MKGPRIQKVEISVSVVKYSLSLLLSTETRTTINLLLLCLQFVENLRKRNFKSENQSEYSRMNFFNETLQPTTVDENQNACTRT